MSCAKLKGEVEDNTVPKKEGMLAGFRALDLTDEKGWLCGRILSDLGVEVIKVEPPGGDPGRRQLPIYKSDPEQSLTWLAYNAGKKSVTLDLTSTKGKELFLKLVTKSDFVLESFAPGYLDGLGLGYQELSRANPSTIVTSITLFGQTGPRRSFPASDITLQALTGIMFGTGEPRYPPVRLCLEQSYQIASTQACAATLIALYYRQRTGLGQHADVSILECLTQLNYRPFIRWDIDKVFYPRMGSYMAVGKVARHFIWRCRDGFINWIFSARALKHPLLKWMVEEQVPGVEALESIKWEDVDIWGVSQEQMNHWEEIIGRFFLSHTKEELWQRSRMHQMTMAPIASAEEVRQNEQFATRGLWESVSVPDVGMVTIPGHFFLASETQNRVRGPAPAPGANNEEVFSPLLGRSLVEAKALSQRVRNIIRHGQALEGIKVLDFTWLGAGPFSTKCLADFGATVVKVESRRRSDGLRLLEPFRGTPKIDSSGMFLQANTGKLDITINLAHPKGVELAGRLAKWADVVAENFTPGTMDRLGLGYSHLRELNPAIIMLSSSCLGQLGACREMPGNGWMGAAISGHYYLTGYPDGEPVGPASIAVADGVQPVFSAIAILAALEYRRRTGKGQWIDSTQIEPMVQFIAPALLDMELNGVSPKRCGNRHPTAAPHGAFPCRGEDRWVAIAVFTDEQWQGLCRAMNRPQLISNPRFATVAARKANEDALEELVSGWTLGQDAREVMELLGSLGVPVGVVQNPQEVAEDDPQLKARGSFLRLAHPVIGECVHPAPPFQLSHTPAQVRTSPLLGQHNEHVLIELIGMSQAEFTSLTKEGVLE